MINSAGTVTTTSMSSDTSKRDVQISKSLSYLLRHGAVKEKLNIDANGYIPLDEILRHNRIKTHRATIDDIRRIVESNDKKRFTIKQEEGTGSLSICANQGHSIATVGDESLVLLSDREKDFPPVIIHGTYLKKLPLILESGLSKMNRNHIHFTYDESPDKVISGMRQSCNVLIYVDIDKCLQEGIKFYRSTNNVILSAGDENGLIKPALFLKVVDKKTKANIDIGGNVQV